MALNVEVRARTRRVGATPALAGVDLEISGGVFGLLGPNGAGKTTLLRLRATIIAPRSGHLRLLDRDPAQAPQRREIRRRLGYLPQALGYYPTFTVCEVVAYFALLKEMPLAQVRPTVAHAIARVGLGTRPPRRSRRSPAACGVAPAAPRLSSTTRSCCWTSRRRASTPSSASASARCCARWRCDRPAASGGRRACVELWHETWQRVLNERARCVEQKEEVMHVVLETERLILRRFTDADVDNLYHLHNDPDVMRFLTGGRPIPRAVIAQETLPRFLRDAEGYTGYGFWAAIEKSSGAFVGWFGFRPTDGHAPDNVELGYRLHTAAWGKGYATEGARALIRRGFTDLGVRRVWAQTMAVNTRSRRVLEKAGLVLVRTFHQAWDDSLPGTEYGEVEYALNKEEWERHQAAAGGEPCAGDHGDAASRPPPADTAR